MVPPDYHWEKVQRILEGDDMTEKKIVQTLRRTSTPGGLSEDCTGCPYYRKEKPPAELIEELGVDTCLQMYCAAYRKRRRKEQSE
jgi:hypothetical protein